MYLHTITYIVYVYFRIFVHSCARRGISMFKGSGLALSSLTCSSFNHLRVIKRGTGKSPIYSACRDIYSICRWFGTFFIFPYIGSNNPNWLIVVETTNQVYIYVYYMWFSHKDFHLVQGCSSHVWIAHGTHHQTLEDQDKQSNSLEIWSKFRKLNVLGSGWLHAAS